MIRKNQHFLNAINVYSDGIIVLCAYLLAAYLWLDVFQNTTNVASINSFKQGLGIAAIAYAIVIVLLLAVFGIYNSSRIRRLRVEIAKVWEASILSILGVASLLYLFKLQDFSRGVLFIFLLISATLLCVKRALMRYILSSIRANGYNIKHVIVVGSGNLAAQYANDINRERDLGFHIDGVIGAKRNLDYFPYLGSFEQLEELLRGPSIDEVVVALEPDETDWVVPIISICEKSGTKVSIVPFYNALIPSNPSIEIIGGTKLINLRSNALDNIGYSAIKRCTDILISIVALLVLSPVFAIVAIGIKLTSKGPLLFKQQRVGRNKRLFSMLKFRSMRINDAQDSAWTQSNDPRRTRFGSFIRKLSIDELPQLINVLRGDMSLVGPRPEIPFYVEKFKESIPLYMVKHQVRPGMTGWAQVNGFRGDTSIQKRIEYDVWYIENWTFGLDFKIILKTFLGGWVNREQIKKTKECSLDAEQRETKEGNR